MEITKLDADNYCRSLSKDIKIFPGPNIKANLEYALEASNINGEYLEFGVREKKSFDIIRNFLSQDKILHGFDCWQGLPEEWKLGKTYSKGILKVNTVPIDSHNEIFWSGLFKDTIPNFLLQSSRPISFCHIDCDLYSSCNDILYGLNERIIQNTILVFDEFHVFEKCDPAKWQNVWNHEMLSLIEWCQQKNRKVEMISRTEWMQATFKVVH